MMNRSEYLKPESYPGQPKYRLLLVMLCFCFLTGCAGNDRAIVFTTQEENDAPMLWQTEEVDDTKEPDGEAQEQDKVVTLYIHVCGAVNFPGVVELPEGSRVQDVLVAAGGLREDASLDYVNLASKVEDGQQLYFPTKEEVEKQQELTAMQQSGQKGLININTADKGLLCTLPGIGASRAEAIITYREQNGGFTDIEDIMKVSGIKQSAYDKLRDKITVK